ncbi:hypothetical protein TIFTF001_020812 [Ficus carica]|uniref:Uncharacterized protein n=1 Tax=Ficus carica TaxID=3494 RepID=A0AA88AJB6_FICCA|nr:hypothetical protein TIFTF001_020812 [Ficus carica]
MSFFTSRDNNLPHPKKVWKHFTHAVRSRLFCFGIPKTCLCKRRRLLLCSSKAGICYHHHKQHHFPPCHGPDHRHLSQISSQPFGDDQVEGHYYQNAPGQELVLGEAFRGEEGENGNLDNVVDLKAQEFIEDFYERLKLERHQSWEEYKKMLARGS